MNSESAPPQPAGRREATTRLGIPNCHLPQTANSAQTANNVSRVSRFAARWSVKGQNLGLTFSLNWTFPKTAMKDRVEDWFQELKLYNYSSGPFT